MECDKYDIFSQEIKENVDSNTFFQEYNIWNLFLFMALLFLLVQLYWGIQNQLNSNKIISDFNSSQYNSENSGIEKYENFKKKFKNDALTKENTSFNKYVGLSSWVMNEEINNIIEEKNWNISYFLQNYAISTSHKNKLCFGPSLNSRVPKWYNSDWDDTNLNNTSKFNSPSLQSTDYSENLLSHEIVNNTRNDKITKRIKRVRFEFPQIDSYCYTNKINN